MKSNWNRRGNVDAMVSITCYVAVLLARIEITTWYYRVMVAVV